MNKRLHILSVLLSVALAAAAVPISKSAALQKARAVAAGQGKSILATAEPAFKAPRKGAATDHANYYVFNIDGGEGFVIIAGDDAVDTAGGMLGYADSGSFDAGNLPANFKAWLDCCAAEVEALADGGQAYAPAVHAGIEPMVATAWNQGTPYNNMIPTYTWQGSTEHYYTGCTITAMAQVMNYHKWPQGNTMAIPEHSGQPALPPVTFDWGNMLDIYGGSDTDTEQDAVARLMYYCAQAVKAEYNYGATGATLSNAAYALKTYFGYDRNLKYVERSMYTIAGWDELIYGELAEGRPVVYAGYSTGGGHAFVCDGYRDALYHINWGWGGYCDGYFRLAVLNPYGSGVGGSSTSDGYSMMQGAVVGICPPTGAQAEPLSMTSYGVEVNGTSVAFSYYNMTGQTATFDIGCEMQDADGVTSLIWHYNGLTLQPNYGYSAWGDDLARYDLAPGTYRFYPVCRESGSTEWVRCGAPTLYATATVSAAGNITVTKHPVLNLIVEAFDFVGTKIATDNQEVKVTIRNNGDEIYDRVYLFMRAPGNTGYSSVSSTGVAIEENGVETVSLFFKPDREGTYSLRLTYDENGQYEIGSTTVDIAKAPTSKSNLVVQGVVTVVSGMPNTVQATVTNNGTEAYVKPVVARLYKDRKDGTGYFGWVEDVPVFQSIEPDMAQTFRFTFTNFIPDERYIVSILCYEYFSDESPTVELAQKVFVATGIDNVQTTVDDNEPYYTLTGKKVDKPTEKGIYIHRGKKIVIK